MDGLFIDKILVPSLLITWGAIAVGYWIRMRIRARRLRSAGVAVELQD
jgi:hypothetical protein